LKSWKGQCHKQKRRRRKLTRGEAEAGFEF
jgi:hypothetical protein